MTKSTEAPDSGPASSCEVVVVRSEVVEIRPRQWGRRGSNDQSIERIEVSALFDRDGRRLEGHWNAAWQDAAPGIQTRLIEGLRAVRIERAACPVTVEMQHQHEYLCLDDPDACSRGARRYRVRYEAPTDAA